MPPIFERQAGQPPHRAAASVPWLALLAATSLGTPELDQVRAWVSGAVAEGVSYRLVVHSYAPGAVDAAGLPAPTSRPIGSLQRAVTAEELGRGVAVKLMHLGGPLPEDSVLVAWVEPGEPTLELDALTARPGPAAALGSRRAGDGAELVHVEVSARA